MHGSPRLRRSAINRTETCGTAVHVRETGGRRAAVAVGRHRRQSGATPSSGWAGTGGLRAVWEWFAIRCMSYGRGGARGAGSAVYGGQPCAVRRAEHARALLSCLTWTRAEGSQRTSEMRHVVLCRLAAVAPRGNGRVWPWLWRHRTAGQCQLCRVGLLVSEGRGVPCAAAGPAPTRWTEV